MLSVYEKAVQNCPWSAELWKGYLLALERHGEPTEKVQGKLGLMLKCFGRFGISFIVTFSAIFKLVHD